LENRKKTPKEIQRRQVDACPTLNRPTKKVVKELQKTNEYRGENLNATWKGCKCPGLWIFQYNA